MGFDFFDDTLLVPVTRRLGEGDATSRGANACALLLLTARPSTLLVNDPARLSTLDLRQEPLSNKLDYEAFERTPGVDLAFLLMRLDVVTGGDAVSITSDQHVPSLLQRASHNAGSEPSRGRL